MPNINWNNLRDVSYQVAVEKGWWESPRSTAIMILLMQTEVAEAVEDYRNHRGLTEVYFEIKRLDEPGKAMTFEEFEDLAVFDQTMSYDEFRDFQGPGKGNYCKPCGIPVELADVAIRICDFAGHHKIDLSKACEQIPSGLEACTFDDALARASWAIAMAYAATQVDFAVEGTQDYFLALALRYLEEMCNREGIDLAEAIRIKTTYNATRPIRHGGKKA